MTDWDVRETRRTIQQKGDSFPVFSVGIHHKYVLGRQRRRPLPAVPRWHPPSQVPRPRGIVLGEVWRIGAIDWGDEIRRDFKEDVGLEKNVWHRAGTCSKYTGLEKRNTSDSCAWSRVLGVRKPYQKRNADTVGRYQWEQWLTRESRIPSETGSSPEALLGGVSECGEHFIACKNAINLSNQLVVPIYKTLSILFKYQFLNDIIIPAMGDFICLHLFQHERPFLCR